MTRQKQRAELGADVATLTGRVGRLKAEPRRANYSRLSDAELRWLTIASAKAHGSHVLAGVDLFSWSAISAARYGHTDTAELAAAPFVFENLTEAERDEYSRLLDLVDVAAGTGR